MQEQYPQERFIALHDANLRLLAGDDEILRPTLIEATGACGARCDEHQHGASFRLWLVARRVLPQTVLPYPGDDTREIVARGVRAGDLDCVLFHVRSARALETRDSSLVGRGREVCALFRFVAQEEERSALYVCGPLGIGKTALLQDFAASCRAMDCHIVHLNARAMDSAEDVFRALAGSASEPSMALDAFRLGREIGSRKWVLSIDDVDLLHRDPRIADALAAMDEPGMRIVVAGRGAPDAKWWQRAALDVRPLWLGNVAPTAAAELARRARIPEAHVAEIATRSAGHPLSLVSLCRLATSDVPLGSSSSAVALDLAEIAPWNVLEAASLPARITEEVLRALLGPEVDVSQAYDELSALCSKRSDGVGLSMPYIVREAVRARLRERAPAAFRSLRLRLADHYIAALEEKRSEMAADDLLDAFDDHPDVQTLVGSSAQAGRVVRVAGPNDRARIAAALAEFGDDAAQLVLRYLDDARVTTIFVEQDRQIRGACQYVALGDDATHRILDDPNTPELRALAAALEACHVCRDERGLVVLGGATAEGGLRAGTEAFQALTRYLCRQILVTDNLAFLASVVPAGTRLFTATWGKVERIQLGALDVAYRDLRPHGGLSVLRGVIEARAERAPFVVGSRSDDTITNAMVREALTLLHEPLQLGQSALALRMVSAEADTNRRGHELVARLRRQISSLGGDIRKDKERAVLEAVFVHRSGKHENIAAELGLPYGTFRRYLARALERMTSALGGEESSPSSTAEQPASSRSL